MTEEEPRYKKIFLSHQARLIIDVVNIGIDSHLTAVSNASTFEVVGGRLLQCSITPKDLAIIVRRLLKTQGEKGENLVLDIADSLFIDEIYIAGNDTFYIATSDEVDTDGGYVPFRNYTFWHCLLEDVQNVKA